MRGGGGEGATLSVTHHRLDVSCAFFYHVSWVFERTLFATKVFCCFLSILNISWTSPDLEKAWKCLYCHQISHFPKSPENDLVRCLGVAYRAAFAVLLHVFGLLRALLGVTWGPQGSNLIRDSSLFGRHLYVLICWRLPGLPQEAPGTTTGLDFSSFLSDLWWLLRIFFDNVEAEEQKRGIKNTQVFCLLFETRLVREAQAQYRQPVTPLL